MLEKLKERWRQPGSRKLFAVILASKLLGVGALLIAITAASHYFGIARADDAAAAPPAYVNPINNMWTLIAAFLVFFMQAGFMMLEAGFARSRETVNILLEGIVDTCLCGILFWAWGFAFMFGSGNGFIGKEFFFLHNAPATFGTTGVSMLTFFLFQFAFADTCSTITSGAMVGRTGFVGDLLYSFGVSGFIYPILGHWAWGPDGWLNTIHPAAFHDFAGSTVVHTIGGFVAMTGAIALGPRLGRKFKRDGGAMPPGHDMVIAAVGGVILWFGWYGFNPGSTLSAMDADGIGRVAANTTLAACAGGLSALAFMYPRNKIWDCGITVNGFLAGLVAITCPCYWVSPFGAIMIGAIAGGVVILAVDLMEWLRIDDPVGAVPVHGFCGIWGTLSLGFFATGQYGAPTPTGADNSAASVVTGLFYGGGTAQLIGQAIGSAAITIATCVVGFALMYVVKATGTLRVSKDGELEGLDLHEHGGPAYPELTGGFHGAGAAESERVMAPTGLPVAAK
ncbi:MAG TPA: ammonium transporter [Polyangiaceae bacterium]|jgi:Amt family ammonium transporter|nr:ammonium transporter [Polyangiaceae bacterium]